MALLPKRLRIPRIPKQPDGPPMYKLVSHDCAALLNLCRGVRRAVQLGDTGQLQRLNDESGRLVRDFHRHWAVQEEALRATASVGELTHLREMVASALVIVEQQREAIARSLVEAGSGPRTEVTPAGLAVGHAPLSGASLGHRLDTGVDDPGNFSSIPAA